MFDLSSFSLKDKTALVTGGSRGIGQGIAFGYARAGARVIVTSRKAQDLEETVAQIKAFGGEAMALPAHLGKIPEIQKVVEENRIKVMQKQSELEAEFKANEVLLNTIAEAQVELSKIAVEKWKEEELKKIKKDPNYFIKSVIK